MSGIIVVGVSSVYRSWRVRADLEALRLKVWIGRSEHEVPLSAADARRLRRLAAPIQAIGDVTVRGQFSNGQELLEIAMDGALTRWSIETEDGGDLGVAKPLFDWAGEQVRAISG